MPNWLTSPMWTRFVLALAHSLWEGLLIALALAAILHMLSARHTQARYGAACMALLLAVAIVPGNLAILNHWADLRAADALQKPAKEPGAAHNSGFSAIPSAPPVAAPAQPAMPPPKPFPWAQTLTAAWFAGFCFMFARMLSLVNVSARMKHACSPITDRAVLDQLDTLRSRMGIHRRIQILSGTGVFMPATAGCFAPVILLPLSAISGASPDLLKAALAHELAHIRRYDYLMNLFQMMVESALFFNPAVWWISRQIRIEREACCDALAARVMEQRTDYAKALAGWFAQRAAVPIAAPSLFMAADGGPSDRLKRLLVPGYRPRLGVSWMGSIGVLFAALIALAILVSLSFLAVRESARALTPKERLAAIEALAQTYPIPPSYYYYNGPEPEDLDIALMLRTADGKPVPIPIHGLAHSERPGNSTSKTIFCDQSEHHPDGSLTYNFKITPGTVYLAMQTIGYAPAFAGPFKIDSPQNIPYEIVLDRGFSTSLRTLTPDGAPLAGVQLEGDYDHPASPQSIKAVTDKFGVALIPNCVPTPIRWVASYPGRQTDTRVLAHRPNETVDWTLIPAVQTSGTVLDAETGAPIAGAALFEVERISPSENFFRSPDFDPKDRLAESGPDGTFSLTQLREDTRYTLAVKSPQGAYAFLYNVEAGKQDLSVRLGKPLYIHGTIHGKLDRFKQNDGSFYLSYDTRIVADDGTPHTFGKSVPLEIRENIGYFQINDLWPGQITINTYPKNIALDVQNPIDDYRIDLNELPQPSTATREVILRFQSENSVQPTGTLNVCYRKDPAADYNQTEIVPIQNGEVRITMPVPNAFSVNPKGMLGYWFSTNTAYTDVKVAPGDGPFERIFPVVPAGCIYGRIAEYDGKPAKNVLIYVVEVEKSPRIQNAALNVQVKDVASDDDATDSYMASPLPLDGLYRILLTRDNTYVCSPAIRLTEQSPAIETPLTIPNGTTLSGTIRTPDGSPLAKVAVSLSFFTPGGSFGVQPIRTSPDGRFALDHVNPDAGGQYSLQIVPAADYQAFVMQNLAINETPLDLRLEKGHTLCGRVIDEKTQQPVPFVKVSAFPVADAMRANVNLWADENGAFRFTNLGPGEYTLTVNRAAGQTMTAYPVDNPDPVNLPITVSDWMERRPRP